MHKRTFTKFHVVDTKASWILGKSTSELLCVLSVLELTRYEQISALIDLDFKYRLSCLSYECKDIFEATGANNLIFIPYSRVFKNEEDYHFS